MIFRDRRLLFFDQLHIETTENMSLVLNPPTKQGACLRIEKDWELGGARAYCVVHWDGLFHLYYKVKPEEDRLYLAVAISSDGISWERPDLGIVEFRGSRKNNLVELGGQNLNEACVFVDPTGPDEHRFKMVCHSPAEGGVFLMTSPDGHIFRRQPGHLLKFIADNNKSAFYDERMGKYVIYLRGWDRSRPIPPIAGTRCILRAETDDLFKPIQYDENAPDPWPVSPKWTDIDDRGLRRINRELPMVMRCDDDDPPEAGLYQAAAVHYAREAYLAFPSLYYSYPWPPEGPFINDGVIDIQFARSRDGVNWKRDFRGSYVRLDLPDGEATKLMHMLTGMVPHGHRVSQYYMGGCRSHGQGRTSKDVHEHVPVRMGDPIAFRLEQRMDGFVSADSAYTGGILMTKPFMLESSTLRLNIDTSASGAAWAALLDENGKEIPGHGLSECDLIQGNDTQYVVSWGKKSDLSEFVGRRVKLLLKSRSTKLFAVHP